MMKQKGYGAQAKMKSFVEETFGYDLSIRLEDIRAAYAFDATCQGSVPIAIMAYLQRANALDTLRLAISMGGDSDTIGCIATSIACSRPLTHPAGTDLPEELVAQCRRLLTPELLEINDRFEAFVSRPLD